MYTTSLTDYNYQAVASFIHWVLSIASYVWKGLLVGGIYYKTVHWEKHVA